MTDDSEFPTPQGVRVVDSDERPGDPLHPGENTIVNRGNHPLTQGEQIHVYYTGWSEETGEVLLVADLMVIGDDGEGDIFAIPSDVPPQDADRVFRLSADMRRIVNGTVVAVPNYDDDSGEYSVTREVKRPGADKREVIEARTLGKQQHYRNSGGLL